VKKSVAKAKSQWGF